MKSLFLVLILLAAGSAADAADNTAQFCGRFKPDLKNCNSDLASADRIYIKREEARRQGSPSVLLIWGYGVNAGGEEILLGKGSRQAPGTDPSIHGQVTQTWETTIMKNVLVQKETIERPSMHYVSNTEKRLESTATDLTYTEAVKTGDKPVEITGCRLVRY